jgi:hypothetical protein
MTTQHTPVFLKHGYGWLDTSWIDKTMDADIIGNALERYQDAGGKVDSDAIIDDAENDPSHPLHEYLTRESLDEAVRQRRREQLRVVFRSLAIVWRNPQTGEILKDSERAYAALGAGNREQTGKFRMLEVQRLPAPKASTTRTYEVSTIKQEAAQPEPQPDPQPQPQPQPQPEPTTTAHPDPQPQPLRVAAPSPAATELSEKDKKALRVLKTWAKSYQHNKFFAPIVAVVDSYPDPD